MHKASLLASGLGALWVVAACGGSSTSGGGSGGGNSVAIADLPAKIAQTECELYQKCFGATFELLSNGEDCVKLTTDRAKNGDLSQLQSAVDKGDVTYDGKAAADCLAEIAARSCDQLLTRTTATCDKASEGKVALGGTCNYDFDCQGTAFCRFTGACPGKCSDRLPAGASCNRDDDCQDGLACSKQNSACVKPPGNGEACGGGVAPDCFPGYFCVGDDAATSKPGTCKSITDAFSGKSGDTCSYQTGQLCTPDLSCIYDVITGTNPGGKCGAKVAAGAACKRFAVPGMCPKGQYCDGPSNSADGTCKDLPGAGQPCVKVLGNDACAAYTRCESGTCVALQDDGGPCKSASVCYSETCVNGACKINECN